MEKRKFSLNVITPLLLFLMTLAGCSSVNTNRDKSASVCTYKTYSWIQPDVETDTDNPLYKGDLIDNSIRESVENELAQKGMMHSDDNPDVYVKYHTFTENKQGITGYNYLAPQGYIPQGYTPDGYAYLPLYSQYYYTGGLSPQVVYYYTEKTLILDFIDAKTNKVVWRGSTTKEVANVSDIDEKMQKSVHSIIKKYPAEKDCDNDHMVRR